MIMDYLRPKTIEEAITLKGKYPGSKYIAGGLSFKNLEEKSILIDLQKIPKIYKKKKNILEIGSTKTLEDILESFTDIKDVTTAIRIEASKNLRNQITLGGLIKKANGRSPFLCCLTAFDSWIYLEPGNKKVKLSEFLLFREKNQDLITKVEIRIPESFQFESIGRSPLDKPIVCCASAKYGQEQLLSIGGFGNLPLMINSEIAHHDKKILKFLQDKIGDDQWASSEYRVSIALTSINRLLTVRG
jgi:CO/xanthine dehydrogenase FAD-binding subunit